MPCALESPCETIPRCCFFYLMQYSPEITVHFSRGVSLTKQKDSSKFDNRAWMGDFCVAGCQSYWSWKHEWLADAILVQKVDLLEIQPQIKLLIRPIWGPIWSFSRLCSHVYSKRDQNDSHLRLPFAKAEDLEYLFPYETGFSPLEWFSAVALRPNITRDLKLGWGRGARVSGSEKVQWGWVFSHSCVQVYFLQVCMWDACTYMCLFLRK